jgi:hypothetical protein
VTGWPRDLVDPAHPEFPEQVESWLFDRSPPEWRTSVLRGNPRALAWALSHHVAGAQEGARRAYRESRIRFEDPALSEVQRALESYGAELLSLAREVAQVQRALEQRET